MYSSATAPFLSVPNTCEQESGSTELGVPTWGRFQNKPRRCPLSLSPTRRPPKTPLLHQNESSSPSAQTQKWVVLGSHTKRAHPWWLLGGRLNWPRIQTEHQGKLLRKQSGSTPRAEARCFKHELFYFYKTDRRLGDFAIQMVMLMHIIKNFLVSTQMLIC